jgi:hypothetical protein
LHLRVASDRSLNFGFDGAHGTPPRGTKMIVIRPIG